MWTSVAFLKNLCHFRMQLEDHICFQIFKKILCTQHPSPIPQFTAAGQYSAAVNRQPMACGTHQPFSTCKTIRANHKRRSNSTTLAVLPTLPVGRLVLFCPLQRSPATPQSKKLNRRGGRGVWRAEQEQGGSQSGHGGGNSIRDAQIWSRRGVGSIRGTTTTILSPFVDSVGPVLAI